MQLVREEQKIHHPLGRRFTIILSLFSLISPLSECFLIELSKATAFSSPQKSCSLATNYYYTSVTPQGQSQGDLEEQNEMGNMLH